MTPKTKKFNLFLDLFIGFLVILLFVLFDLLYVSIKSGSDQIRNEQLRGNGQNLEAIMPTSEETIVSDFTLQQIAPGQKVFAPILNFHHIDQTPADLSKIAKSYYVTQEQFTSILGDLKTAGFQPVFVSQMVEWLQQGVFPTEDVIALTFDDGNEDFYTQAWPLLQQYQFKSSMYIMTGVSSADYLTKEQIRELDKSGLVEFGSHTVWHPKLTKISESEQLRELTDSKKNLADLLNKEISILCYPFGLYNNEIKKMASQVGYQAALTFDQDAWQNPADLFTLTRISVYPELPVVNFLAKLKQEK